MSKIIYTYAVFDILHRGHIIHLENSKSIAGRDGKLICGVLNDEAVQERKPKPIMNFFERLKIASSLKMIDEAIEQKTYSPINNVKRIKPDILIESTSHTKEDIEKARKVMKELGGEVIVLPYFPEQSSTSIKNQIKNDKRRIKK